MTVEEDHVHFGPDMSARIVVAYLAIFAVAIPLAAGAAAPLTLGPFVALSAVLVWCAGRMLSQATECSAAGLVIVTPFRRLACPWRAVQALGGEGYSLITLNQGVRFRTVQYEYRGIAARWLAHHTRAFQPYTQYMPVMRDFWERYRLTGPDDPPVVRVRWPSRASWVLLLFAAVIGEGVGIILSRVV